MKIPLVIFVLTLVLSGCQSDDEASPLPQEPFVPLTVSSDWDGSFEYQGVTYPLCSAVDIDIYLYDEFGRESTNFAAARANCPEVFELGENFEDGTYTVYLNAYNHLDFSQFDLGPFDLPVTMTFSRNGMIHQEVFDTISTQDSIWQVRDGDLVLIEAGEITKEEAVFEWKVVGQEKIVFPNSTQ